MAKLYLVRHGETEYNHAFRFQGQTDIPLNKAGLAQAERVGEFFRTIPLAAVYCSSLQRARDTAQAIGRGKELEPVVRDAFREIDFGEWEGKNSSFLQETYGKEWKNFFAAPAETRVPGGESMKDVQLRAYPALQDILDAHPEGDVALVAHGGIIRVLFCAMLGLDLNRMWHLHVGNASTTCFYYWGRSYTLEYANINYYLDTPPLELKM